MKQSAINIFILVIACSFAACDDEETITTLNYANFTTFAFEQSPALGFCPDTTIGYKCEIINADNQYQFSSSELKLSAASDTTCVWWFYELDTLCWVADKLPYRILSDEEVKEIKSVFANISIQSEPPAECSELAVDPCRIFNFTWNNHEHSDYYCSRDKVTPEQVTILINLIKKLEEPYGYSDKNP